MPDMHVRLSLLPSKGGGGVSKVSSVNGTITNMNVDEDWSSLSSELQRRGGSTWC